MSYGPLLPGAFFEGMLSERDEANHLYRAGGSTPVFALDASPAASTDRNWVVRFVVAGNWVEINAPAADLEDVLRFVDATGLANE